MTCIKTGAYVSLPDYGLFLNADLYRIAGAIIIRCNADADDKGYNYKQNGTITHSVYLNDAGANLIRFDLGIIIVEERACTVHLESVK